MIQQWDTVGVMEVGLELVNARYRNKSLEISDEFFKSISPQ